MKVSRARRARVAAAAPRRTAVATSALANGRRPRLEETRKHGLLRDPRSAELRPHPPPVHHVHAVRQVEDLRQIGGDQEDADALPLYEVFHEVVHFRSEEHTSELQSLTNLVCRLLLEKKKK